MMRLPDILRRGTMVPVAAVQPGSIPPAAGPGSTGDALWLLGGGVLALLALGFLLTRRARQKTSEPVFDQERRGQTDEEDYVEPLL